MTVAVVSGVRSHAAEFSKHDHASDEAGMSLPYRLLAPPEDVTQRFAEEGKTHPLLVFLHGAGERGDDNEAQLKHGRAMMERAAEKYGAFVVAPQCPKDSRWSEKHWLDADQTITDTPSKPMQVVLEIIAEIGRDHAIDADRRYIMGLSMGGYGTWDALARRPAMFAAGVPICGGGDVTQAEAIKDIPVWVWHGDADRAVPVERSREMVAAIRKALGADSEADAGSEDDAEQHIKYSELPGVGHDSWSAAFSEPEMLAWLFAQQR